MEEKVVFEHKNLKIFLVEEKNTLSWFIKEQRRQVYLIVC